MAASALPTTLKSVTSTKIAELKKQRDTFEGTKQTIKAGVKRCSNELEATESLVSGACRMENVRIFSDESSDDEAQYSRSTKVFKLNNAERLIRQAKVDPAFPKAATKHIFDDLTNDLNLQSLQHQHAQFFSELVTEWVSNPEDLMDATEGEDADVEGSTFEAVGRKEMHEQRKQWEDIVFHKADTDASTLNAYLDNLFKADKTVQKAHDDLKKSVSDYCYALKNDDELFDTDSLKISIKGLFGTDLMGDDKKAILKTFSSNKEVLKEVADVLNMRFRSLETWQWTLNNGAIPLEQRRQLNGKYRVFMDEDVLDALLVYAIGMRWATHFRQVFMTFYNSYAWHRTTNTVPLPDRERREWFLGRDSSASESVQTIRKDAYSRDYFLTQLPETVQEGARGYDDDSEDGVQVVSQRKHPLETKHSLLHLLVTEALLARHLHPERNHSVIRSDFRWFGPSLSHTTIFEILRFFGVDAFWLEFFRKFLQNPLRFAQDGPGGQVTTRVRGVPMSHPLSDTLSEAVMFVMDFAVNKSTYGNLYRLHDDFWFWGSTKSVETAWSTMKVFASTCDIEFNEEKTGSVTFESVESDSDMEMTPTTSSILPEGKVTWGFLHLSFDTGRFELDQSKVDEHIKEFGLQLSARNSIFSYVQAYNAYLARFFINNFGKPCQAFGRPHIDSMISTLARIQNALFPNGRVTDHLLSVAKERFSISDLPEAFFYWPVEMGGLELRNPLVSLFCMRESMRRSPERILEKALESDEAAYLAAKEHYEQVNTGRGLGATGSQSAELQAKIGDVSNFISKEEYLKYREERSPALAAAYNQLLSVPDEKPVAHTTEVGALLQTVTVRTKSKKISKNWSGMDAYWRWVVAVYGPEVKERFGGLQMTDAAKVPLGVVGVMKQRKTKWRG